MGRCDLQELINRNVAIDEQAQEYTYGELNADVLIAVAYNSIFMQKELAHVDHKMSMHAFH